MSSQNSHFEILTPNVVVLGVGALGRSLGHECGALVNGISALIKKKKRHKSLLLLSALYHVRTQQEDSHLQASKQVLPRH